MYVNEDAKICSYIEMIALSLIETLKTSVLITEKTNHPKYHFKFHHFPHFQNLDIQEN